MAFLGSAAPYILAGASAVASQRANTDLEERRRAIAQQMEDYQRGKAVKGEDAIQRFIDAVNPARRAADSSDIRAELQQGLEKSVGAAQALAKPDNFEGKVSENYLTRRASNDATTAERLRRAMQQLAIIGTPAERNLRTGFALSDSASDVDSANAAINASTPAYTRAINSLRPDRGLSLASQALGGASMAYSKPEAKL
jgi:hypothetical protein